MQLERATQGARLFGLAVVGVLVIVIALVIGTNNRDKNEEKAACQKIEVAFESIRTPGAGITGLESTIRRGYGDCVEKGYIN